MTISSSDRVAGPFAGNGVTTAFPFSYKVFTREDVTALLSDGLTETPLVLDSDFSVSINADQNANPGGTVTYPVSGSPMSASYTLTLSSDLAELQPLSLSNQGGFYPKVIENAFDRCVILLQQLRSIADRTLRFPLSDTGVSTALPPRDARANNLLGFDSDGEIVAVLPAAQSATALQLLLAGGGGAALIGSGGETAADKFAALQIASYAALRDYDGELPAVDVTGYLVTAAPSGVAGRFARDDSDTTSVDNGGTIIVSTAGVRWKRVFTGNTHVDWFGADPSGVAFSHTQINAALASITTFAGTAEFSRGNYKLGDSVTTTIAGQNLVGASLYGTYLTTPAGSTFDILRVASAYCRVSGFLFRPGGNQLCAHIYAASCTFEGSQCLAATNNVGTAVLATDVNPVTGLTVAGAYTHRFDNNVVGVGGFAFAIGFDCSSTNGMQSMVFTRNKMLSDRCIVMPKGGANWYAGNQLQSSTGIVGAGVGIGIDLGADAIAEKIGPMNYFENFAQGVLMRNLSNTYQVAHIVANHYDNCTAEVTSLGATNYIHEAVGGSMTTKGWVHNYSSATLQRWLTPSGGEGMVLGSTGIFQVGTTAGINHTLNTIGAAEAAIIFTLMGGGNSAAFFRHVTGGGANSANTCLSLKANSVTIRSINAGGTINASGADFAEYLVKAPGCGIVAKGQIVGLNSAGLITDRWEDSIMFLIKSTAPGYVGGDIWFTEPRPETDGPELEAWEAAMEAARQQVDRLAFCGQVPVNVTTAAPGDYIVPVQDGDGIGAVCIGKAAITPEQYMAAIGRVMRIEPDGRARVIVKPV